MNRTIGCIIARTASTRLPKKVLRKIGDKLLIEQLITKIKNAKNLDRIYLCSSIDPNDQILLKIAKQNEIESYAGSRDIVIDRMLDVAKKEEALHLVRITGDNVFCDEIFLDKMIELHIKYNADYTRTSLLPLGITAEVFSVEGLKNFYKNVDPYQTEYLTYYVFFKENNLKKLILYPPQKFQKPFYNLSVDTPEDLERTKLIFTHLKNRKNIYLDDILELHKKNEIPHLEINKETLIKFPNKQLKIYREYLDELEGKYKNCITVKLEEDFYEQYKNR